MDDIIRVDGQSYIKTSSAMVDQRLRVLKQTEVFGIFDVYGDIKPIGIGTQGLYLGSTRFISQMELKLGGKQPVLLSSTITNDDMLMTADLSNPDSVDLAGQVIPHSTFHVFRSKYLTHDACQEKLQITNFSAISRELPVSFRFQTDFVDMFEIRGIARPKHGTIAPAEVSEDGVTFTYVGLDSKQRQCRITFSPRPHLLTDSECTMNLKLAPRESQQLLVTATFSEGIVNETVEPPHRKKKKAPTVCLLQSSSEGFQAWFDRSKSDISLMTTKGIYGDYPYAGIPWFNTVFGRDGIITALQYLWINPDLAANVLRYLAKLQAREDNAYEDAEPGKILHELRNGEMVDTGEVPFKKYYGSADSTPLFIILAGRYAEMTGDVPFIAALWPSIELALKWIDKYGDRDGDGFIEYLRRSPKGLNNQGWKDSSDCISHVNGELAEGPIALCEIQGYVFEAKLQAAKMATYLGRQSHAWKLTQEAQLLRKRFNEKFWDPKTERLALALDGNKKPCQVLSSNAGQCLFSGILNIDPAKKVAAQMFSEEMFSGWGIRTLSTNEVRYNPMSYHNGSIWPHDNSLIAEGFARYLFKDEALKLAESIFDVSTHVDLYRMPELFCGFPRRPGQGPTLYPVACSPQAWAAGSAFLLIKACLGLEIDGFAGRITFSQPVLPSLIEQLWIKNLKVGETEVDLFLKRHGSEVSVYVERRTGKVEISIVK